MQELDLKFLAGSGSFLGEKTIIELQNIIAEPIEKIKIFEMASPIIVDLKCPTCKSFATFGDE